MGLIVITPLAGFVSPLSTIILGLLAGHHLLQEKGISQSSSGSQIL
ncbi:MAG: hypothetical protein ACP5LF_04155 [Nitrososphaeria archaeon]